MAIPSDSELLKQWNKQRGISEDGNSLQHRRAKINHSFHHGNEAAYPAIINGRSRRRMVTFNKVKPFIDAVCGFMIQLRRKPDYQARMTDNKKQQFYSMCMNNFSDYLRDNANMDQIETRQDREMLIAGYGAVDSNISYEKNPDGEVVAETIKYDEVYWDPQSQEPNMLDSRWVYRKKVYSRGEAMDRFQDSKPEDFEEANEGEDSRDFVYNPYGGAYDKIAEDGIGGGEEDLVKVFYYQYWTLEKYYRARNPLYDIQDPELVNVLDQMMNTMKETRMDLTEEDYIDDIFDFDPRAEYLIMTPTIKNDMQLLFERISMMYGVQIEVEYQEFLKKCYYTAIVSGRKVLRKFKSPDQQGFTIKFKTGSFDPDRKLWMGMVDSLREPAKYANKALTEMLFVIASNSKGGVLYEEGAVDDPARFEQEYAGTNAAIKVNDGALSNNKIQPKATASLPSGYEKIYEISESSLTEVSGVNREFLASSANNQVSALLEAQRINQVIATLADYFDSIGLYQIESARLFTTYIKMLAQNSQGRLVSLIGQNGVREYIELTEDKLINEYDIEIGETPISATQKQETLSTLLTMADKAAVFGVNILATVTDYLNIKQSDKQILKAALTPNPEVEQFKMKTAVEQRQEEKMLNQSITQSQFARAEKDMADKAYKLAQIPKLGADVDETQANTVKILNEAENKSIENTVLKNIPVDNMNVSI